MSPKNLKPKILLVLGSSLSLILTFLPFYFVPLLLAHTLFLIWVGVAARSLKQAFWLGWGINFLTNAGLFWWVTYAIHEFGYMPYWLASLIFLLFCFFGSLNFPLFTLFASYCSRRYRIDQLTPGWRGFWFVVVLPAAFTVIEWLIPKLFPFYIGHSVHWLPMLTQISELTGAIFLSFLAMSLGGALCLLVFKKGKGLALSWGFFALPWVLLLGTLSFGTIRIAETPPPSSKIRVAIIQANIGSLEKVEAQKGYYPKVRYTLDRYKSLTMEAMKLGAKPDLIIWPETAMPMQLDRSSPLSNEIYAFRNQIDVPLLTGAYATDPTNQMTEYNAAFLLKPPLIPPQQVGFDLPVSMEIYRKNILLAFGEYFPGGDTFPALYRWFPQVAKFGHGTEQNSFTLGNGIKLGVTICYEIIIPEFYRAVARSGVRAVVNIANDSWFGPTTEPRHHALLSTFRSVESRLPLLRATNTGVSFFVDRLGRVSGTTGIYESGVLVRDVDIPDSAPTTLYLLWGEWFVGLCAIVVAVSIFAFWRTTRVSLSH